MSATGKILTHQAKFWDESDPGGSERLEFADLNDAGAPIFEAQANSAGSGEIDPAGVTLKLYWLGGAWERGSLLTTAAHTLAPGDNLEIGSIDLPRFSASQNSVELEEPPASVGGYLPGYFITGNTLHLTAYNHKASGSVTIPAGTEFRFTIFPMV